MTNHTDPTNDELTITESTHLREYLEYYKNLSNPGYGVLVTGDWGSGKTHQVNEILGPKEIYYISLFGTQTTEEIYSAVFATMHPYKANTKKIAASTNGAGLGVGPASIYLGGLLSGVANAIIREQVDNKKIIVFDDLERSKINTNDLLGVFNKYIEHHNCRVVVLAHDKKITEAFNETKEKVFGQTIAITPQTEKALDSFINEIKDNSNIALIAKFKPVILDIFNQSQAYSLRILKYALEDLVRLYNLLSPTHKSNEDALFEITSLFLALNLDVRAGRLDESSLRDRNDSLIRFQMACARNDKPTETPKIYNSYNRYKSIDVTSQILNDDTLINILIRGSYLKKNIHESLNQSLYFTRPDDLPAWLVFSKFDELSDQDSRKAAEKLKTQFESREIIEAGEILHLFALRFLFSEMKLISSDFTQTEKDCIQYLEDLLNQDKIEPYIGYDLMWSERFTRSYGGQGYWVEDSYKEHFSNIKKHLRAIQERAAKKRYPEFSKILLGLMSSDGAKFAEKICHTNSGNNDYAAIDILASIPPSDFVQEWMGSPAKNWKYISRGLEERYSADQLSNALKTEKAWITEVISLIDHQIKNSTGIRKKRTERILLTGLRNTVSRS